MPNTNYKIAQGRAMTLAGFDKYFKYSEMGQIPALWQELVPHMATTPHRVEQVDYGVCHDMDSGGFWYMAGFEVSATEGLPEGFKAIPLPAQRYIVADHEGDLSTICDTVDILWKELLPSSGEQSAEPGLMFERYGPGFDPHRRSGDIQMWLALKV